MPHQASRRHPGRLTNDQHHASLDRPGRMPSKRKPGFRQALSGDPGPIRTGDLRLRRASLYPAELRGQAGKDNGDIAKAKPQRRWLAVRQRGSAELARMAPVDAATLQRRGRHGKVLLNTRQLAPTLCLTRFPKCCVRRAHREYPHTRTEPAGERVPGLTPNGPSDYLPRSQPSVQGCVGILHCHNRTQLTAGVFIIFPSCNQRHDKKTMASRQYHRAWHSWPLLASSTRREVRRRSGAPLHHG
jgi:hypothetical protein